MTNKAIEANEGKPLPLYQKALCGLTAGAIGATVGSPADLALIRMQADATLPLAQRRNYTNAFHALSRIATDEGVLALWKGAGPTVVRAMALNMGMLASYDQSVEFFRDNLGLGEAATVVGKIISVQMLPRVLILVLSRSFFTDFPQEGFKFRLCFQDGIKCMQLVLEKKRSSKLLFGEIHPSFVYPG